MSFIKKIISGAAVFVLSVAAHAAPINVGGVVFDPDSIQDFSAFGGIIRQIIQPTGEVTGYGLISSINGTGVATFCPGPCQLTFQFSGFMPINNGALPSAPGQVIEYTGGLVNVFVHSPMATIDPNDALSLTLANTGLNGGSVWLSLDGHESPTNISFIGKVQDDGFGNITGLQGNGQLDVTGGLAAAYFDTNTKSFGSDLTFAAGFVKFFPNNNLLNSIGNGSFAGDTSLVEVPEPASLTLLGLGLLGAGLVRRRKQAK